MSTGSEAILERPAKSRNVFPALREQKRSKHVFGKLGGTTEFEEPSSHVFFGTTALFLMRTKSAPCKQRNQNKGEMDNGMDRFERAERKILELL